MTPALAKARYLAARDRVDGMIAGRLPCQCHPDVLRRRAITLRSSPDYVAHVQSAEAELNGAGDDDGLGILPFIIMGVMGLGALAAWKGFSWAEEREKRLACEANPDDCGGIGQYIPILVVGLLGLAAYSYVQTGRIPFLGGGGEGSRT